jgi:chromosome segregation ATPase
VATKEIERDIGEIKGVLEGIKTEIDNLHTDQSDIFTRLGKVEQTAVVNQEQVSSIGAEVDRRANRLNNLEQKAVVNQENIINISKRIDKICEDKEKEKEAERAATNTKLTIIGIILAAVEVVMGIIIAVAHI